MSLHISIVHIMLLTKHRLLFLLIIFVYLISLTNTCNIWKASECPKPPTADDEEIV